MQSLHRDALRDAICSRLALETASSSRNCNNAQACELSVIYTRVPGIMLALPCTYAPVAGSNSSSFATGRCLLQRVPPQARHALCFFVHAAHKKGGGSTKNGRDSNPQMRGVKVYGGQQVKAGGIIIRQLGTQVSW